MKVGAIILAAGKGTRMYSDIPKVLHKIAGKPMLNHVLDTTKNVLSEIKPIVIYGHCGEQLKKVISDNVLWVEQKEQNGTAHAVKVALDYLDDNTHYMILVGDAPLIKEKTLKNLILASEESGISLLTTRVDNSKGYGRIVRDQGGDVLKIVEEKDASDEERNIKEINTGFFVISGAILKSFIPKIKNNNMQREYYLTDIVDLLKSSGKKISTVTLFDESETLGCNDKSQLLMLERIYQKKLASNLLQKGTHLYDSNRIDIRGNLSVGKGVVIDVNCIFEGDVILGDNVYIGANCIIKDSYIGDNVTIKPFTMIDESKVDKSSQIGPYARVRPETQIGNAVKIGNFVELKKSTIKDGSKVNHLSYIGDTDVHELVNIGAGTITCNYDGKNKHKTTIKSGAFIGSNTALIAPVVIHEDSVIAAGSTITKDVPENNLGIARQRQKNIVKR